MMRNKQHKTTHHGDPMKHLKTEGKSAISTSLERKQTQYHRGDHYCRRLVRLAELAMGGTILTW